MKVIGFLLFFALLALFIARPAHAIIFLPALILIPIAKLVAVIIGGFSIPALGVSTLWSTLFRKSLKRTITVTILILLLIGGILIIIFKLHDPSRPFI